LKSLKLESGTRLQTIESSVFCETALTEISLPNSIRSIKGSAFLGCHFTSISFFSSATAFDFRDDMLEDISGRKLIHDFGNSQKIEISSSVEVIRSYCFMQCESLEYLIFEVNSRLEAIENCVFEQSGLKVIEIPRNVEILGDSCFYGCKSLVSVTFENGSKLEEIPHCTFSRTS
jgi:hypothetical protein